MSENILEVIEPGLLTSLQDLGREGFQAFGIPPSGAYGFACVKIRQLACR